MEANVWSKSKAMRQTLTQSLVVVMIGSSPEMVVGWLGVEVTKVKGTHLQAVGGGGLAAERGWWSQVWMGEWYKANVAVKAGRWVMPG